MLSEKVRRVVTTISAIFNAGGLILGTIADWKDVFGGHGKAAFIVLVLLGLFALLICVWWPGRWWFRQGRFVRGKTLHLCELDEQVSGKRFEDCTFVGPAVIAFLGDTTIESPRWTSASRGGCPVWYPTDGVERTGMYIFRGCDFIDCRFHDIGVAGPDAGKRFDGVIALGTATIS